MSYLRTRSEIAPSKIGLLGRSEGGWVGTLAASRDPQISFEVMSSGCAIGPYQETLYWTRTALRAKGVQADRIEEAVKLKSDIWDFYRKVAEGKIDHVAQRSDLASLGRFSQFVDLHPELPPGIMDPDIEDPRKFSAFTHMTYYDPAPRSPQYTCHCSRPLERMMKPLSHPPLLPYWSACATLVMTSPRVPSLVSATRFS